MPDDGKKISPSGVSAIVRRSLKNLGISYKILADLHAEDASMAAGTRYLLNTYKTKVESLFPNDPAAAKFLQALSLDDNTTASHYRSFTCPEAQRKLFIGLRRFGSGLETSTPKYTKHEEKVDGYYYTTITPDDSSRFVSATVSVRLKPGEFYIVEGEYGLMPNVISVIGAEGAPADVVETVPYYQLQSLPGAFPYPTVPIYPYEDERNVYVEQID